VLHAENPSARQLAQFHQEAELSCQAGCVRKVLGKSSWQGKPALVLEALEGRPLAEAGPELRQDPRASFERLRQTAYALDQLHSEGIIHQQINPHHIFAASDGVRLIGLGQAYRRGQGYAGHLEQLEAQLAYLAPEQSGRTNRGVDERSDLYALGVSWYELVSGRLPFEATDKLGLIHAHLAQTPAPLDADESASHPLRELMGRLILKLMAKNPEDRYQSAHGLVADLERGWQEFSVQGRITPFEPGSHDVTSRFAVSQRLYGRQAQIEALQQVLARVSDPEGRPELVLVAGPSGVGKTSLIQELQRPLLGKRGYFIYGGKYDQLQRNTPYAALIQGFSHLVSQLLTESPAQLAHWRERILNAIGPNGQVLIEVIPDLALVLGPQPPVARLGPVEAQNRFNHVFQQYVQALCQPEHPLMLFIDDLQWADTASLNLLKGLLAHDQIRGFLVIGAYRDNEVDAAHPFSRMLAELGQAGGSIETLTMGNLEPESLEKLLSDSLHLRQGKGNEHGQDQIKDQDQVTLAKLTSLARLIQEKTRGNAFFVHQFLSSLAEEGLLAFDRAQLSWDWDLDRIEARNVTDNVVTLMSDKLRKLPPETLVVLQPAASIGNRFDLASLALVEGRPQAEVSRLLWPALAEGLILPQGDAEAGFRFLHDRVQQAAYALTPEPERAPLHLKIGRLLLAETPIAECEERLFDILNHLNTARELIQAPAERMELAALNLQAARKAKLSAAYEAAARFAAIGAGLLPEDAYERDDALAFALNLESAETEYLIGNYAGADALYPQILAHCAASDQIRVHMIQMTQYAQQGRYLEAIEILRQGMAVLGEAVPAEAAEQAALLPQEFAQVSTNLGQRRIEELIELPEMQDADKRLLSDLMGMSLDILYVGGQEALLALVVTKMVNLALLHGSSEMLGVAVNFYAVILQRAFGDFAASRRYGELGVALAHRYGNPAILCKQYGTFGCFIIHWYAHMRQSTEYSRKGFDYGLIGGEFVYAGYNAY
ncbi:MAG: AAA family ATPase, partial [Candidatus Sericytochromatia bacterium]